MSRLFTLTFTTTAFKAGAA